jgi:hypothetical protein
MAAWDWLTKPQEGYRWGFVGRVALKASLLFLALNVVFALAAPLPFLGSLSLYNSLFPGRERLPYGENPAQSYNLSLDNLDAMFASHVLAAPKAADEFRVLLLGDSSTWGFLLSSEDTLAAMLNAADLTTDDGRQVRVYNLGYPIMSLTKDLVLLDYGMAYQPDLIVWLVTLESFPRDKQLFPPLLQHNPGVVRDLIARYDLALDPADPRFVEPDFWGQTIVGRRRELNDLLRLQLYGVPWALTGIDQYLPAIFDLRQSDFEEDVSWQEYTEPVELTTENLAFDALSAGMAVAGDVPVLLINEPMFVSTGQNSDLRYNFFYPRWAYDAYHALLIDQADTNGWHFADLWDALPADEFTDSPVHYTPAGAQMLADQVAPPLLALANGE